MGNELRPIADKHKDVKAETKRQARAQSADDSNTIAGLIPEYLEYCELSDKAPRTIANYEQYLRPLKFLWGDRHPSDLTRADAQTIFHTVRKRGGMDIDGNHTGRGGDRAAGLVHSASRAFYSRLIDREIVDSDPWAGQKELQKKGAAKIAQKVLTNKQTTKAMKALKGRDGTVFRLLLATGLRPHNACEGRWSHINLKAGTWTIPASQMKWRDGPDHVIYLSDYAKGLLKELQSRQKGRPRYLFPSEGKSGHLNVDTIRWGDISPKVCRATASTMLQELGCPSEVRSRIRHHSHQTRVEQSYEKHLYQEEAKDWWQRLGEKLASLEPDYTPNNVVRMKRRA